MGTTTYSTLINDMREWMRPYFYLHDTSLVTNAMALMWFKSHVHTIIATSVSLKLTPRDKQALEIWANYCILEEV